MSNYYAYFRNKATQEIHRRIEPGGFSVESCNLDDLLPENREELAESDALRAVAADPTRACGHCWPSDEAENVLPR